MAFPLSFSISMQTLLDAMREYSSKRLFVNSFKCILAPLGCACQLKQWCSSILVPIWRMSPRTGQQRERESPRFFSYLPYTLIPWLSYIRSHDLARKSVQKISKRWNFWSIQESWRTISFDVWSYFERHKESINVRPQNPEGPHMEYITSGHPKFRRRLELAALQRPELTALLRGEEESALWALNKE